MTFLQKATPSSEFFESLAERLTTGPLKEIGEVPKDADTMSASFWTSFIS